MRHLRELAAATQHRTFLSEAGLDVFLKEAFPRATPEERISMKHFLAANGQFTPGGRRLSAQGGLATDQLRHDGLATDRPEARYNPRTESVGGAMGTWLRKAGLSVDRAYSQTEIDEALGRSPLDVTEKIAVRHELAMRGRVRR
jgi:hypothetical protein